MIYLGFLVLGLAGTLHCIGMCGPILLAAQGAQAPEKRSLGPALEYQAGRIWTYTMLGLLGGALVAKSREVALLMHWQRPLGVALALATTLLGLILLVRQRQIALVPTARCPRTPAGVPSGAPGTPSRFFAPVAGGRPLLVGALVGLIPCSLVYATLLPAVALGSPLRSAMAMAIFGVGTATPMTALLVGVRHLPVRFRRLAARAPGLILFLAGCMLLLRSLSNHG